MKKLALSLMLLPLAACHGQQITGSGTTRTFVSSGLATTASSTSWEPLVWQGGTYYQCDTVGHCWSGNVSPVAPRKNVRKVSNAEIRASAKLISWDKLAPETYLALAHEVGMDTSASSEEAKITQAIYDLKLPTYPFNLVDDYLYNKAIVEGKNERWVWRPMRSADLAKLKDVRADYEGGAGVLQPLQYARRVPSEVLETAKALLEKDPAVNFLISDYTAVKPDPFLAVTTPGLLEQGKIWIVAVWDEPGFRYLNTEMGPRKE